MTTDWFWSRIADLRREPVEKAAIALLPELMRQHEDECFNRPQTDLSHLIDDAT